MEVHWRDVDDAAAPGDWGGLLLTVRDAGRVGLAVSVCAPRCVRVSTEGIPLVWARIYADYYGYELLRPRRGASIGVIPPIRFSLVAEHAELDALASNRGWARHFAEMLTTSPASPLRDGTWLIGNAGLRSVSKDLDPALVQRIVAQRQHGNVEWDLESVYPINLRLFSSAEHGRVRAWRKHARAGSLPPVLLYWVSGLAAYVVLDGHDRLAAAALEGSSAPVFALEPVEEQGPSAVTREGVLQQLEQALASAEQKRQRPTAGRLARVERLITVDDANQVLLNTFVPKLKARATQADLLRGGVSQWVREVGAELALQGIVESQLLDGLSERATGA